MRSTVSLECPDFHFSKTLSSELCLSSKRLLGDKRVRSNRSLVNLILDHVSKFKDVHVSHTHLVIEWIACATVVKRHLSRTWQSCTFKFILNRCFWNPIENGCHHVIAKAVSGKPHVQFENL